MEPERSTPEPLRIAANAVRARLFDAARETRLAVSEMLSYEVEGAERTDAFRMHRWDGRSSLYELRNDTFPAGFVPFVARELGRRGHPVVVARKPLPAPLGPAPGTRDYLGFGFEPRYDYQPETVRALLRHGRIIARIATGGGKSAVAVMAAGAIGRPTIFLTTRSVLMHQMAGVFRKAGMEPGILGDGEWAPRRGVNVAMVQTIAPRLAEGHPLRERTLALLKLFEFAIGEEVHEVGGTEFYEVMNRLENAHYRLGLTATPFMRPDGEANMRLMAAFGQIGAEVGEALLIERGILARPSFKILRTPANPVLRRGTRWPACYEAGIVEAPERNRLVVREVHRAAAHGLPSLVLIQRRLHGEILEASLREAGVATEFIFGAHGQAERQAALDRLKRGEIRALVGSTILDVGVDVPAVGLVALAGGGKAEVGHRQRIGRGLREKRDGGPNVCFVLDFDDAGNRILQEHALTRRAFVEQTPGFAEGLLGPDEDFDYAPFAARRAA